MEFSDGSVYEGDWLRGLQSGKGRMVGKNGAVMEGNFKNNVFYGNKVPAELSLSSRQHSQRSKWRSNVHSSISEVVELEDK